jgi:nucleotide-binding universal stress UspA family protein
VVGVDFSPASLEKARSLARRCEVDVDFVEADATKLPVELHNRFDLVYSTIGVICWIDDLRAWMRSAAAALRGGAGTARLGVTTEALTGSPKRTIVEEAEAWGADLIVVGSHGYKSWERMLLGSVSQAVAAHARCSVEIVRCNKEEEVRG